MYELESVGINAFEVFTKSGRFACMMVQKPGGHHVLYWNTNSSRGSARKFKTQSEAIEFMHQRRIQKGWSTQ